MASLNSDHAFAILVVQETERALDSVSQKLDLFRAELDERRQPVQRMIRTPNQLAASILADRRET